MNKAVSSIMPRRSEAILMGVARWMSVMTVVLSAWLFGSGEGWSYLVILMGISLSGVAWCLSLLSAPACRVRAPALTVSLLLLVGYVGLQGVPLGPVSRLLNPHAARLQNATVAAFEHIPPLALDPMIYEEGGSRTGINSALSTCPAGTHRAFVLAVGYALVFLVILNSVWSWAHIKQIATVLAISGFVIVVVAIIHQASGDPRILWLLEPRYGGHTFGPFSNRNHAAAYLNMLNGVCLGLLLSAARALITAPRDKLWSTLAGLSSRRAGRIDMLAFCVVLLAGCVCITLSRAGILSFSAALVVVLLAVTLNRNIPGRARYAVLGVGVLVLVTVFWLGAAPVTSRLATLSTVAAEHSAESRISVTRDTFSMFRDHWLCGVGAGTFRYMFPRYSSRPLDERYLYAHNDWVQFLAEMGVVGFALLIVLLTLWCRTLRQVALGMGVRLHFFLLGFLVTLISIALHSVVGYALHKPSVMLLFVLLAGLALGAAYVRRLEQESLRSASAPKAARCNRGAIIVMLAGCVALLLVQQREWCGELGFIRLLYQNKVVASVATLPQLQEAVIHGADEAVLVRQLVEMNPEALRDSAASLLRWGQNSNLSHALRVRLAQTAAASVELSVLQAPADYLGWLWLARSRSFVGEWDAAECALQRARVLVRNPSDIRMLDAPEAAQQQPSGWESGWR